MEFAAFLAFIKAVGEIAGTINNIIQLVKNIQDFSSDPTDETRDEFLTTYAAIIQSRQELLYACADILNAIQALDQRIFESTLADKLGDSDQAIQALDNWHRSGSEVSKDLALNDSAGAIADILRLSDGVYPRVTLLFGHVQIMAARLAILADADPDFGKSAIAAQPIVDGIALIRASIADLKQGIVNSNKIDVNEWVTQGPWPHEGPRPQMYWIQVSYRNASGTASYSIKLGPRQDEAPDTTQALMSAEAAQVKGIADDTAAARISQFSDTADRFEQILHTSEMHVIETITNIRFSLIERARYAEFRRSQGSADSLDRLLEESRAASSEAFDFTTAVRLLQQSDTPEKDEALLREVFNRFGRKAMLRIIMNEQ